MPIEMNSESSVVCYRCGKAYGRRKGNFPVCYAPLYRGIGYLPYCRDCIEAMFNTYYSQCNDTKQAVHQMCQKLNIYWSEPVFEYVMKKSAPRTVMIQYIARTNASNTLGKSYDDSLAEGGALSWGAEDAGVDENMEQQVLDEETEAAEVDPAVIEYWGLGYPPKMYEQLEQRRSYWIDNLKDRIDLDDVGTQTLLRQICFMEIDINRDRAKGRDVTKSVTTLVNLLSSANIKPDSKKQEEMDANLEGTPLGVWLYRYEKQRPLPEVDDDLKDVNGLRKYVMTWVLGHICKMLGVKNAYSKMYEDEIARLRVDKPEYEDEDDETFMMDYMEDSGGGSVE